MQARFHDGRTSAAHPVAVAVEVAGEALRFEAEGVGHLWLAGDVEFEAVAGAVRLSRPGNPARLVLDAADWRALGWARTIRRGRRRREWKLVLGLALAAAVVALFVFVGMPLASGPLARATPPELEAGIGENFAAQMKLGLTRCTGADGQAALQAFGAQLGEAAGAPFPIRVEAVEAPMANAFALPGGRILVTDDLIEMAGGPDELAAVLAHEVAHVERRDVMQAVWRSLGLGLVLDALVGGGTGAGQQAVLLAGSAANLRYGRDAEQAADAGGQAILHRLGLSSRGMAKFFARLSAAEGDGGGEPDMVREFVSTHPGSGRRAHLSRARERAGEVAFDATQWAKIRAVCAQDPKRRLVPRIG